MPLRTLPRPVFCLLWTLCLTLAAPPPGRAQTTRARDDFYGFVNAGWLQATTIPADYGRWGTFEELHEKVLARLWAIAEAAAQADAPVGSVTQKVGSFYQSGMDEAAIEQAGAAALSPALLQIERVTDAESFVAVLAELHKIGPTPLFALSAAPDARDSNATVAHLEQAGMGLPEPGDYRAPDKAARRQAYRDHVARMFALLQVDQKTCARHADTVLRIEGALAEAALMPVQRRDPLATYNRCRMGQLESVAPGLPWRAYLDQLGVDAAGEAGVLIVEHVPYLQQVGALLPQFTWAQWRTYLTWHALTSSAPYLSDAFVQEHFDFFGRTLYGAEQLPPRHKRVLGTLDDTLGEALGALYVEKHFPAAARAEATALIDDLRAACQARLEALDWMGPQTKAAALQKLQALRVKVGYPDRFEDAQRLAVGRHYLSNVWQANAFAFADALARIGQPPDLQRWAMTPQTVNAYYSPRRNEIVFPAAILQPPFFDPEGDVAANYGAIGAVIGHELTHGFDDQGRHYDAAGNLVDWWTAEDAAAFDKRAAAIVAQFDRYQIGGQPVSGALTQGENIADLGGARLAFAALQRRLARRQGELPGAAAGLTPEQRFFTAWARLWRNQTRPQAAQQRLESDPHAPGVFRTNGPLSNMPEFYEAFGVSPGDGMYREAAARVQIW